MNNIESLIKKLSTAENIVIITHNNPDGDALGSSLGLVELIRDNFGKTAPIIHTGKIPKFLDWMPGRYEAVKKAEDIADDFIPDLAIMVDTSGGNTGDESMAVFNRARDSIKIDHHQTSPDIANLNIHKIVNSTAEVILEIAHAANWKINTIAADCLYTAISSDTGRFSWVDDPSAFDAAADCMRHGARPRDIEDNLAITTKDNILANAKIMMNAEFLFDNRLAISTVPLADYAMLDGKGGHAMEWLRTIDTVEYVALLKEPMENIIHISLRSRRMDVNKIAAKLGGGGHLNAAAVRLNTDLETAKQMILAAFAEVL
ncbi:MAG: DHH family phosphoesterase [Rickettsiales bacterium]|jgi:phosphoesterase RecJ-like protein|nr:DHH family phosphoesterase [Rickettsiales bacterium]